MERYKSLGRNMNIMSSKDADKRKNGKKSKIENDHSVN